MNPKGTIIQNIDSLDIIDFLTVKNKRVQAIFLSELETLIDPKSEEFTKIRKLFLDCTNNYKRAVLTSIFGDVENE